MFCTSAFVTLDLKIRSRYDSKMPDDPPIRLLQEASLDGLSLIRDEVQHLFSHYEDE